MMVSKRVGGANSQSTLTFKLIDASGNAIQTPTELALSLDDASKKAGVLFDDGTPILIRSPILYTAPSVATYEVYSPRFAVAKSAYLIS